MREWRDFCRECDGPAEEISGNAPRERVEPCGHESGYYGRLVEIEDPE